MKYFFFDLDGSLMYNKVTKQNETYIPSKHIQNLNKLQNLEGVEYGIASGRIASVSKKIFDNDNLNGWIIGENGGTILNKNGEYTYTNRISPSTYYKLAKFAFDNNYHFEAYTDEILFVNNSSNNHSPFLDNIVKKFDSILTIKNISSIDEFGPYIEKINHLSFVPFTSQENLQSIKDYLSNFEHELDWINSSIDIVDTMPRNIDKIVAFKEFIEKNNIDKKDIHYLGDGFNDLKTFQYFENIYVMDHAHDSLKNNAKYIVSDASEAIEIFINNYSKKLL